MPLLLALLMGGWDWTFAFCILGFAAITAVIGAGICHGKKLKLGYPLLLLAIVAESWVTVKCGIDYAVIGMLAPVGLFALLGLWGWLSYFTKPTGTCEDVSCPN